MSIAAAHIVCVMYLCVRASPGCFRADPTLPACLVFGLQLIAMQVCLSVPFSSTLPDSNLSARKRRPRGPRGWRGFPIIASSSRERRVTLRNASHFNPATILSGTTRVSIQERISTRDSFVSDTFAVVALPPSDSTDVGSFSRRMAREMLWKEKNIC